MTQPPYPPQQPSPTPPPPTIQAPSDAILAADWNANAARPAPYLAPQPYVGPQYVYAIRPTNGYALWSAVFGIWGLFVAPTVWFLGIGLFGAWTSLLGVILGHVGLRLSRERGGVGHGSSVTGLVTGYLGTANAIAGLIFVIAVFAGGAASS